MQSLDLLRRSEVRLLTFTGAGGVEKTRLAVEVARKGRDDFADDLCFVPLGTVDDPALVAPAVARFLGVGDAGERPALARVELYLQDRELLLVLDGFEQVVDAAPLVAELLDACLALKVLVASREALRLSRCARAPRRRGTRSSTASAELPMSPRPKLGNGFGNRAYCETGRSPLASSQESTNARRTR